jgi:hypothetical protein
MRLAGVLGSIAAAVLAGGCGGSTGAVSYATFQHRDAAIAQIRFLVAAIPQYPGARESGSRYVGTSYHVTAGFIEAAPYSAFVSYELPQTVSGPMVMAHFRRVLAEQGWSCRFQRRSRGVPYGFSCRLRHAELGAYVADHGHYELDVTADDRRPPIRTIQGD